MRLGRFGQWKFLADHWTQRFVLQTGHERGVNTCHLCRWRVWQYHPAKIDVTLHRVTRIDLHAAAAPDNRDTATFRENGQIFAEIHVREQFHDYIHTAARCCLHDLLEMVRRVVIE